MTAPSEQIAAGPIAAPLRPWPAARHATTAWLRNRRHVWRYRAVSAFVAGSWLALLAWSLAERGSSSGSGGLTARIGSAASVCILAGCWAVYQHGMVETAQAPAPAGVASRQARAVRTQRAATGLSMVGALTLAILMGDNVSLFVSAGVIVAGFLLRSTGRTRKAATAVCHDIDEVLTLQELASTGRAHRLDRRRALLALSRSGNSGIDSGFATGWWGVRTLHPETIALLVEAAEDHGLLPEHLLETLAAHRSALAGLCDAAA